MHLCFQIPISLIDTDLDNSIFNDDSTYTMIESEVYFEPYYHVLKALQEPTFPEHLAMQQYIVKVDVSKYLVLFADVYLLLETNYCYLLHIFTFFFRLPRHIPLIYLLIQSSLFTRIRNSVKLMNWIL